MASVTGRCSFTPQFSQAPAAGILSYNSLPVSLPIGLNFLSSGVLADMCDLIHAATYTFVASTGQTIDLTALLDPFGGAVNFARIRFGAIRVNSTTDAASLTLGNAAANPWAAKWGATGTSKVLASTGNNNGFEVFAAPNTTGYPTSGSSKNLLMLPSAHAFTADLILAGCST